MMRVSLIVSSLALLVSFYTGKDRKVPVYKKYESFKALLEKNNDTTYVINFWATWCKPCVEELPYFERINGEYDNEKVKVILATIDFRENLNNRVLPFLKKEKIKSQVVLFDDHRQNDWIPKIDENWSGSIPATYIYKGDSSVFYEQSFTYNELKEAITPILNYQP